MVKEPNLLQLTPDLYAHFASSLRYSTQALPVNTLLDTLVRPNADTELNPISCVEWQYEPEKAISHVAIGDTQHAGGQWADNPVDASTDIGTLSYAEQLSLPGYSYADHVAKKEMQGQCDFVRPSRTEVAEYLRAYPEAVGIAGAVFAETRVDDVHRTKDGFVIGSLSIKCKHLVLASGTFNVNIPPPTSLAPIAQLNSIETPLLVIGSGFSAADVIISAPSTRRIVHIFKWAPEKRPSPLRGCHHTAYPEYAAVYRQMKIAAVSSNKTRAAKSPMTRRKSTPFFTKRDWDLYEGMPNAEIIDVSLPDNAGTATIIIRLTSGETITREVGGLDYVVGRRGTLNFLSNELRTEILSAPDQVTPVNTQALISGRTLRTKAETSTEVAKHVFIVGSLTGDSLIRHAIGGCVFAAGRITDHIPTDHSPDSTPSPTSSTPRSASLSDSDYTERLELKRTTTGERTNGHADLHLDRRKLTKSVEVAHEENRVWVGSGWWAGGLGPSTT